VTRRDRDYETLRASLQDLRAADERRAPSFQSVLARRPTRPVARVRLRGFAIAAGLALAAGLAYRMAAPRRERLTVPSEVVALLAWRPQSDALLETPIRNLLRQPQLGASLITPAMSGELR
jgi:hypothetical protein